MTTDKTSAASMESAEREAFEAHIKTTAWYQVLSLSKDEDDDGASVFRMARMAARAAWDAALAQQAVAAPVEAVAVAEVADGKYGSRLMWYTSDAREMTPIGTLLYAGAAPTPAHVKRMSAGVLGINAQSRVPKPGHARRI
jgi:hypothetical protein